MTVTAELADGRRLEFPDWTEHAVVQATVKKLMGATTPATEQQQPRTGERLRHASDSFFTNMPDFPKSVQEFATGGTNLLRGIANIPSKVGLGAPAGDAMFPPQGDPESGWKTAGQIADPLAWAIGGGVPAAMAKTLERMAASGPAAAQMATKLASNWAGRAAGRAVVGGATGGTIGALSDEGDAGTGAGVGAAANVLIPPVFGGVMRGATAAKNAI